MIVASLLGTRMHLTKNQWHSLFCGSSGSTLTNLGKTKIFSSGTVKKTGMRVPGRCTHDMPFAALPVASSTELKSSRWHLLSTSSCCGWRIFKRKLSMKATESHARWTHKQVSRLKEGK
jgi:hypothetical protein